MRVPQAIYIKLKLVITIFVFFFLSSCSNFERQNENSLNTGQPGEIIQQTLVKKSVTSQTEILDELLKIEKPNYVKKIIKENTVLIAELYKANILLKITQGDLQNIDEVEDSDLQLSSSVTVSALISLFPVDAYRLLSVLNEKSYIETNTMLAIAADNKLDPTILLKGTASGLENSVTPLIHSAGIVIYGQYEDSTTEVKFRETGSSLWLPAFEFGWEPIYGAFSGSIVHLQPDTDYEVEVLITDYEGTTELHKFDFKTRPNTPPIDPNKIYYLSDIYSGGQLDLEALDISGSEGGYAKIIGDGQVIEAGDEYLSAVNIGSQAYIMLENLTIEGGSRYGILANETHDIWIKGCNISKYGNVATDYRNGIGYKSTESTSAINYDSGIYLEKTGVAVIEECEIHSPNGKANHWGYGHPKGPNALQVWAYHPDEEYRGQTIVRNNRFYGSASNRFNDVIEGRKNFERTGGFVRDSAVYGNYLAYANDDLIEVDGGQRNVLVYENELTQGYAGISVAPNMLGPSYIFHNYIHDLGDERGKEWTAVKAGGLMVKPGGKTFLFENYIDTNRNGIASSSVNNDSSFWLDVRNNIIITRNMNNLVGLGIYDKEKFISSKYINNIIFNTKVDRPVLDISAYSLIEHPLTNETDFVESLANEPSIELPISREYWIDNFSRSKSRNQELVQSSANVMEYNTTTNYPIEVVRKKLSSFSNQTKYGTFEVTGSDSITISGNAWYKIPVDYEITSETLLTFDIQVNGDLEIAGLALETNNTLTQSAVFQLDGSQNYGNDLTYMYTNSGQEKVQIKLADYNINKMSYIVFILDNDIDEADNNASVIYSNLRFEEPFSDASNDTEKDLSNHQNVVVGQ